MQNHNTAVVLTFSLAFITAIANEELDETFSTENNTKDCVCTTACERIVTNTTRVRPPWLCGASLPHILRTS